LVCSYLHEIGKDSRSFKRFKGLPNMLMNLLLNPGLKYQLVAAKPGEHNPISHLHGDKPCPLLRLLLLLVALQ
jgi:hypothetical protein